MIVTVGIPLIIILTVLSAILIYCCKKNEKVQNFGKKLKEKLIFGSIVNIMIFACLGLSV
jgi:hypothetical protein